MGTDCLVTCPACDRHVRCGTQSCPFCGATIRLFVRVADYRLKTRLNRGRILSLGAALTAAGFATDCGGGDGTAVAIYGAPCNPPQCQVSGVGGSSGAGGTSAVGGASGSGSGSAGHGSGSAGDGSAPDGGIEGGGEGGGAGSGA